ncbi:MAG: NAD-dependent epimerase/dehydratase family protein [candidate division KSB1 bacterium]|nr:NAD-dependent epimerase/dehydratase family protein [candidate division KSB1 bacterium]
MDLPETIASVEQLEEFLSRPSERLIASVRRLDDGDLLLLGAGGKMGPTLARMALRAFRESGDSRRVYAASRFSAPEVEARLREWGICTLRGDLLDREFVRRLPDARYVVFMAGRKFGTAGDRSLTWALNALLPGLIGERFRQARIICFSTGNVYPLVPLTSGGATEDTPTAPVGEYAQSALARERIFEYFSRRHGVPVSIIRLNYAVEMRYGVVLDIATRVWQRQPVSLAMPAVNVIWQGDACEYTLRSFEICASPPAVLNVTGPELVSVRWLARELHRRLHEEGEPEFIGSEPESALLSNAARCFELFGYPNVPLGKILQWTCEWVRAGLPTHDKPTHFDVRDGEF